MAVRQILIFTFVLKSYRQWSSAAQKNPALLTENLDGGGEASCEILATDLLDEFAETSYNPLWTMRGHKQIFHHWRESKRMQCIPVGAFITYVMQPWSAIVRNVLDHQKTPVLTFWQNCSLKKYRTFYAQQHIGFKSSARRMKCGMCYVRLCIIFAASWQLKAF